MTEEEPAKYWLATEPADTDFTTLVRRAKLRWRLERYYPRRDRPPPDAKTGVVPVLQAPSRTLAANAGADPTRARIGRTNTQ